MATYLRGKFWWYRFRFAGERIDEPTKSTSRTVAKEAERQHRRTLEAGYNNFKEVRQNRVRILEEIIEEYLTGYRLRYRSASFAEYALGHVSRLLGTKIVGEITEISVLRYQEDRLRSQTGSSLAIFRAFITAWDPRQRFRQRSIGFPLERPA